MNGQLGFGRDQHLIDLLFLQQLAVSHERLHGKVISKMTSQVSEKFESHIVHEVVILDPGEGAARS